MLKLENTEVVGWEAAIRGTRNSMKSLEKSDSFFCKKPDQQCSVCEGRHTDACCDGYAIGTNDHKLIVSLTNDESVRANFRRMITVHVDITAPLYWWNKFDVGANSCGTMQNIHEKMFTMADFSSEHLMTVDDIKMPDSYGIIMSECGSDVMYAPRDILLNWIIPSLNACRKVYIKLGEELEKISASRNSNQFSYAKSLQNRRKEIWWQMIQLLPNSYNQRRTVMLSYEALAGIYPIGKNHKLDEWHDFCHWIESLPYSELITGPSLNAIPIAKEIMEEAERRVEARIAKQWDNFCAKLGVDLAK